MKGWLLGLGILIVVAAALTWLFESIFASDGIEMGFHGTFAVFLTLVIIPGLAIGLMRLAILSDTKGVDQAVGDISSDQDK